MTGAAQDSFVTEPGPRALEGPPIWITAQLDAGQPIEVDLSDRVGVDRRQRRAAPRRAAGRRGGAVDRRDPRGRATARQGRARPSPRRASDRPPSARSARREGGSPAAWAGPVGPVAPTRSIRWSGSRRGRAFAVASARPRRPGARLGSRVASPGPSARGARLGRSPCSSRRRRSRAPSRRAASEAVPTPASTITGTRRLLDDDSAAL